MEPGPPKASNLRTKPRAGIAMLRWRSVSEAVSIGRRRASAAGLVIGFPIPGGARPGSGAGGSLRSGQGRQRLRGEGQQLVILPIPYLPRPGRIDEQRAADRDQIEFIALQPFQQRVDAGGGRTLAAKRGGEFAGETDAADRDRGLAGQLPGPAGEVEIGSLEFRFPVPALRAMEDIDAGGGQRLQKSAERLRVGRELRGIVLKLPL